MLEIFQFFILLSLFISFINFNDFYFAIVNIVYFCRILIRVIYANALRFLRTRRGVQPGREIKVASSLHEVFTLNFTTKYYCNRVTGTLQFHRIYRWDGQPREQDYELVETRLVLAHRKSALSAANSPLPLLQFRALTLWREREPENQSVANFSRAARQYTPRFSAGKWHAGSFHRWNISLRSHASKLVFICGPAGYIYRKRNAMYTVLPKYARSSRTWRVSFRFSMKFNRWRKVEYRYRSERFSRSHYENNLSTDNVLFLRCFNIATIFLSLFQNFSASRINQLKWTEWRDERKAQIISVRLNETPLSS